MLGFMNSSWLTRNTEVLTTFGWMDVSQIEIGAIICGKKGSLYIEDKVISTGKCNIDTFIRVYSVNDGLIRGKHLLVDSQHKYMENYSGPLYHFTTQSNTLIIRNYVELEGIKMYGNDYYVIETQR